MLNTTFEAAERKYSGIEAVLPLAPRDLERFQRILFPSLDVFAEFLPRLWVVTPRDARSHIAKVSRRLQSKGFDLEIISELNVVPEMVLRPKISGWYRQQLVKLAIVDRVETDFYLALDADVLCNRLTRAQDLVPDSRALLQREPVAIHPDWYDWASRVLDVPSPTDGASVTPNMFSVEALGLLRAHVENRFFARWRLEALARVRIRPWLALLVRSLPWTEYSLYVTFLEASGILEKYHCNTDILCDNNVWSREQFDSWDPANSLGQKGRWFFSVIQSNLGIPAKEVACLVDPFLHRARQSRDAGPRGAVESA